MFSVLYFYRLQEFPETLQNKILQLLFVPFSAGKISYNMYCEIILIAAHLISYFSSIW